MKHKKLFAILTLVCFMFTLMPVAAFAEGDIPDGVTVSGATATVTTASGLEWALNNSSRVVLANDLNLSEGVTVASGKTVILDLQLAR